MLRLKYLWFVIGNDTFKTEDITDLFMNIQLRLETNLQIAIPKNSEKYEIYEIYKLGIGVDNTVRRMGSFSYNKLMYTNKWSSFYDSRKNLTNVLLRTGNTVY